MTITSGKGPVAKAMPARQPMHPMMGIALRPILPVLAAPSLPLAGSRNGSLFADRFVSNLHWYLPEFVLAADVDAGFAFAVSQTAQQQANGQPFDVARLALTLTKQQPAQAIQFAQANPNAVLREIPLENLAAVFTSGYVDQAGNPQQRAFSASTLHDQGNGSFLLVFDGSILGESVLAVYQDLRTFGKATVVVNANFQCWTQPAPALPRLMFSTVMMRTPMERPVVAAPQMIVPPRPAAPSPITPPPAPALVEAALPFNETLPINLKYNADGYQLRYTIAIANLPGRVILGTGDLSGFSQQTQFAELKELGDLSLKYPSVSRVYFGVVSRTIVVIPQRYTIVRGKNGCSATCLARVDSSPSSTSRCAFEFDFVIAPEASTIDLAKLTAEIAGHPDLNGFQITFAGFLQTAPLSTLNTSFASSVQFAAGPNPNTFALTITVQDGGTNAPAVANANLVILQLCAQSGTDLIGSLSLKLDDGYQDPVPAVIDLNFARTAGGDDVLAQIDTSAGAIKITNQSPLDLWMQNYALIQGGTLTEEAAEALVSAGGSVSLPLPANAVGISFAFEAQLALPPSMDPPTVAKFLNFQTVNVQSTQYILALDASGIDFVKVASVACTVTLPTLPSIAPWQTTLTANLKADSSHIQIPIENALFTLPGTINLIINAANPTTAPLTLTLQNDFTANPVMTLLQSQLVGSPSPSPLPTQPTSS